MDATAHTLEQPSTGHHDGNGHEAHHPHPKLSFLEKYIFSLDHKVIGIQFLFASIFFLLVGGLLAMMLRWQLGFPGEPLPAWLLGGVLSETVAPGGVITPEFYNSLFTTHATFMIFFAMMPLLIGVFGNFLIPLQLGARDMAFPIMNMLSFWIALPAGILMLLSFFVEGGAASGGWTGYPPLSTDVGFTGVGLGMNLWLVSLLILGVSSLLGAINYITTIINMRAPGMTLFRMPLPVWSMFITAILLLLAIPVLTAALVMLLLDRTVHTGFFLPTGILMSGAPMEGVPGGGQPLLYQHLFWFFGHPEVYILVLPGMGIASELLSTFSRKPIFGYRAMVFSMCGIAFLGWIVWGHHMFQSGMNPTLGTTFMISTMVIAVPSAIKVFNWLGTIWGGQIHFKVPMLHALAFISMFTIGGLSGIFMASTPVDSFIHDTYFIVAHFHYVIFGGSLFAAFGAITFWFPKMFGRMMNPALGKIHFWLSFVGFNCVFFPMHILGVGGHMRRIYDPLQYEHLVHMQDINVFITISAFVLGVSQLVFVFNIFYSLMRGEKAPANPWNSNTLEWTIPSPAGHGNYATIPTVYHGPYEYSSPLVADSDFLPQDRKVDGVVEGH